MDYQSLIHTPNALMLLCLMLHETDEGKRPFMMSQAQIGRVLNLARQQVRDAIAKLVTLDLIQPSDNQADNQVATYLTNCKISISKPLKPSNNQANNQVATKQIGKDIKPFDGEDLSDDQRRYNGWLKFCKEKCPYVTANIKQLDFNQFLKLRGRFGASPMSEIVQQIENRKDLRKKYTSLYLTMFNWLKRNYEDSK